MKKYLLSLLAILLIGVLAACGSEESTSESTEEKKELVVGGTVPYTDMLSKAIVPVLEEKGYKVTVKEFADYVQPNLALTSGSLDANLFQQKIFLETFNKENDANLYDVITVPTAPIGIYSNEFKSLDEIKEGSTVAVANDPANLSRGLTVLRDAGLITFNEGIDPLYSTPKDIKDNPKNLKFHEVEAAQLPRSLESVDLAAVNGNFAVSAGLDLTKALYLDKLPEEIQNRVAVRGEDKDKQFVKDIIEAVESDHFKKVIDEEFKGFEKPDWMLEKE